MNYFAYPTAAERYAKGRPFFHFLAVEKIRTVCCEAAHIARALDVGCGTGQSTAALLELAHTIIGLDSSAEMLAQAIRHAQVHYIQARAEQLPFADGTFGLLTVGLAFHWFDRRAFMTEAQRVLRPNGWLVLYNDWFVGRMAGNEEHERWFRQQYLVRYPSPPRNHQPISDSDAGAWGFAPSGIDGFTHEVEFTPYQLVSYLLTQTNVIAAVETGREDSQSVARWLLGSVQPLFSKQVESFSFACEIRFLKKVHHSA